MKDKFISNIVNCLRNPLLGHICGLFVNLLTLLPHICPYVVHFDGVKYFYISTPFPFPALNLSLFLSRLVLYKVFVLSWSRNLKWILFIAFSFFEIITFILWIIYNEMWYVVSQTMCVTMWKLSIYERPKFCSQT